MSGKELLRRLEQAGWTLERVNGSHHIMAKGSARITVPVHANRDLSTGLLNKLLKEAGLK
jgi:predicted RNA binding protein YcfA (HicA-like mRNA interferase family)